MSDVYRKMHCWTRNLAQTNFILFIWDARWWMYEISNIYAFSRWLPMWGGGYRLGDISRFFTVWLWENLLARLFRFRNNRNYKTKLSTFQNTKNFWKILIIEDFRLDNVSDFHDEKSYRYIMEMMLRWTQSLFFAFRVRICKPASVCAICTKFSPHLRFERVVGPLESWFLDMLGP